MSYYFHQNIAFIAFKSVEQIQSVCRLRLYTEDDHLLTGRPHFLSNQPQLQTPLTNNQPLNRKAITSHTNELPDLHSKEIPSKRPHTPRHVPSLTNLKQQYFKTRKLAYNNHFISRDDEGSLSTYEHVESTMKDLSVNIPLSQPLSLPSPDPDASLELILAKLNELEAIKTHLNAIDSRIDNL